MVLMIHVGMMVIQEKIVSMGQREMVVHDIGHPGPHGPHDQGECFNRPGVKGPQGEPGYIG